MKLIDQNTTKRVDSLGRVTIPSGLRKRMKIKEGDEVEVYTLETDDGREMIVLEVMHDEERES